MIRAIYFQKSGLLGGAYGRRVVKNGKLQGAALHGRGGQGFSNSADNNGCICIRLGKNGNCRGDKRRNQEDSRSACQPNAINDSRISTVPLIFFISDAPIPREDQNQISTSLLS